MKQAVMQRPGVIVISDIEDLIDINNNQILLNIKKIGVCGSDIHVYHGKHPFTPFPVIQGHEYSGVVTKVGDHVKDFQVGDYVTARPQLTCGLCGPCKIGNYNVCTNLKVEGFQAPGVAQDYFAVDADRAYKISNDISLEHIALIEPAAVGAHATSKIKNIADKNIVVMGAGPIGNLIAQFARIRGAKSVVITDFNAFRLDKANEVGITNTINLATESFEAGIFRVFGDEGFQVGIEAVGVEAALHNLVNSIEKGGEVVIVGVYEEHPRINMGFVCEHELTVNGSMMYKDEDYKEAISYLCTQKLNVDPLITHRFDFYDYKKAYEFIDANPKDVMKVIIEVN